MKAKHFRMRTKMLVLALSVTMVMSGCTKGAAGGPEGDKKSDALGKTTTALGQQI